MPHLPVVKDKDIIKVLLQLGFSERKTSATSHIVYAHTDGRRATIARHSGKDIPRGTLRGILRDINISPDELRQLL